MKKIFEDKITFVTALIGMVLMGMAIVFRINPVEESVVPSFLTRRALCNVLIIFLARDVHADLDSRSLGQNPWTFLAISFVNSGYIKYITINNY